MGFASKCGQLGQRPPKPQEYAAYTKKAASYLDNMGLRHLTEDELRRIAAGFSADMQAGLAGERRGLAMFNTCLSPTDLRKLSQDKLTFVGEVGGTHVRGAIVEVGDDGYPQIIEGMYSQAPLGKTDFADATDFLNTVASRIEPRILAHLSRAEAAALIYSFPGVASETEYGIDVVPTRQLSKEIVVNGIGAQPVGISFFRPSVPFEETPPFPIIVGNDTPFVLQSGGIDPHWLLNIFTNRQSQTTTHQVLKPDIDARVSMGLVNSSGMNFAIVVDGAIYNIEAGNFDQVPTHTIAERVDKKSKEPGRQLAEKQVSANWLGAQMDDLAEQMVQDGYLSTKPPLSLTAVLVTQLLKRDRQYANEVMGEALSEKAFAILVTAAERVRTRSAQIFGTLVGAGIKTYPDEFGEHAVIPCESTLMAYVPGYQQIVEARVKETSGIDSLFLHIPHAGIIGAGAAALSHL